MSLKLHLHANFISFNYSPLTRILSYVLVKELQITHRTKKFIPLGGHKMISLFYIDDVAEVSRGESGEHWILMVSRNG